MTQGKKLNANGEVMLNSRGMRMTGNSALGFPCCCSDCCKQSVGGVLCCYSKTSQVTMDLTLTRDGSGCLCADQDFDVTGLTMPYYGCLEAPASLTTTGNEPVWMSQFFELTCPIGSGDTHYFYTIRGGWVIEIWSTKQGTPGLYPDFGTLLWRFNKTRTSCCSEIFTGVNDILGVNCSPTTVDASVTITGNTCCVSSSGQCCDCESTSCGGLCDYDSDCTCCRSCNGTLGCPHLPDTLAVDISGLTGTFSSVNGIYPVARDTSGGTFPHACEWVVNGPGFEGTPCSLYSIRLFLDCAASPSRWRVFITYTDENGDANCSTLFSKTWIQDECENSIYGSDYILASVTECPECGTLSGAAMEVA